MISPLRAALVMGTACVIFLTTQCVRDYQSATPETFDAVVVGGDYTPGHSDMTCTLSADNKSTECHSTWVPPAWTVTYADEEGTHSEGVDEKTFDAMPVGAKVYVSFWQGHVLGLRYGVRFWTTRPSSLEG